MVSIYSYIASAIFPKRSAVSTDSSVNAEFCCTVTSIFVMDIGHASPSSGLYGFAVHHINGVLYIILLGIWVLAKAGLRAKLS